MGAEIGFADCIVFASTVTSFIFLRFCQKAISILKRQSLLRLNWPEHLDSICISLSTQPEMQRKEFGWMGGGMVSGMVLKSVAALKEKEQQRVMLQSKGTGRKP